MDQNATNASRPPRDPISPFDRRHFLRTAAAAGIAACCPGLHGIARADIASDQKARDLLKAQLKDPTPYAVVKDMNFRGATRMSLADLERHLDDREFMFRDHVKFFAAFANGGKIADRKPSGELASRNGPIVWIGGDGLPPGRTRLFPECSQDRSCEHHTDCARQSDQAPCDPRQVADVGARRGARPSI